MNKSRLRRNETKSTKHHKNKISKQIDKAFNKFTGYYKNYERN